MYQRADRTFLIDRVLPDYPKLSNAPPAPENAPAHWYKMEAAKEYKAIDTDGNVYLCQNPASSKFFIDQKGRGWLSRRKPKRVMTYEEALEAAKVTPASAFKTISHQEY